MTEKLPLRPTPEQVARVFKIGAKSDEPEKEPQKEKGPRKQESRSEKPAEVFALTGFFDKVELRKARVGDMIFMVPSLRDIQTLHEVVKKAAGGKGIKLLEQIDKKFQSNHDESVKNVTTWIERGIGELYEADAYFKSGKNLQAAEEIKNAHRSFAVAQEISKTMGERYFPTGRLAFPD